MAIATNDSLIVNKEGAPIDARTVAPTLAALAEIENPYVGLRVFVTETGKEYRVTEIEEVAVGAFTKKRIKTYEALPDAAALEDTFAVIQNLTENHSLEIGFDNAPLETTSEVTDNDGNTVYQTDENGEQILDEEGNPIPETETERAFQCFVRGSGNSYGSCVTIHGDNNENSLGFVRIYGSNNKTYQFQNIFGDLNELTASVNVTVFGNSNKDNGKNANGAVIIGNLNEVTAANTFTAGYRVKNFAKGARAFGRYFTLEDTPENEYAFALGDGELDGTTPTGEISLIHRVFKAAENPLFNPDSPADDSDASDPNPKDSSGERKYVAERAYATEYRGHWLAVTRNVDTAGTVTLDHDFFARWNLTASGEITLSLANWKDGDSGELIVDTTKQTINIPADWVTLGADITKTPGVYVLEIAQVGSKIFYSIKWPKGSGGGDSGGGDSGGEEETVTLSGTSSYDISGATGTEITPITFDMVASDGSPVTYSVYAGSLPDGVTLTGDTISGTPTVSKNENVYIKAAAGDATQTITLAFAIEKPLELYRMDGTSAVKLADIASTDNLKVDDQANVYIIDGKLYVKGVLYQEEGWTDISCNNNLTFSGESFNSMGIRNGNLYIMSYIAYYGADNDWSNVFGAPCNDLVGYASKSNGNLYLVSGTSSVEQVTGISGVTSVSGFFAYSVSMATSANAISFRAMAIADGKLYVLTAENATQIGELTNWTKVGSGINSNQPYTLAICDGKLYKITTFSDFTNMTATQIGTMTDWSDVTRNYAIRNGELYYFDKNSDTLSRVGTESKWTAVAGGEIINQNQTANVYGICDGKLYQIDGTITTQIGTDTGWESLSGQAFITAILK